MTTRRPARPTRTSAVTGAATGAGAATSWSRPEWTPISTPSRHTATTVAARAGRVPAVVTCRMTVGAAGTRRQPAVATAATAATGHCRPRLGPAMRTAAAAAAAGGTAAVTDTAGTTADVCRRLCRRWMMGADAAAAAAVCVAALAAVASRPTSRGRGTTTIVTAIIGRMTAVAVATAGGVTAPSDVSCRPTHHGTTTSRLVVRRGGGTAGAATTAAASAGRGVPTGHWAPLGSPPTRAGGAGRAPVAAKAAAATDQQRQRGEGARLATAVARSTRTRRGWRPVGVRARPAKTCRWTALWSPAMAGSTRSAAAGGTTGTRGDWRRWRGHCWAASPAARALTHVRRPVPTLAHTSPPAPALARGRGRGRDRVLALARGRVRAPRLASLPHRAPALLRVPAPAPLPGRTMVSSWVTIRAAATLVAVALASTAAGGPPRAGLSRKAAPAGRAARAAASAAVTVAATATGRRRRGRRAQRTAPTVAVVAVQATAAAAAAAAAETAMGGGRLRPGTTRAGRAAWGWHLAQTMGRGGAVSCSTCFGAATTTRASVISPKATATHGRVAVSAATWATTTRSLAETTTLGGRSAGVGTAAPAAAAAAAIAAAIAAAVAATTAATATGGVLGRTTAPVTGTACSASLVAITTTPVEKMTPDGSGAGAMNAGTVSTAAITAAAGRQGGRPRPTLAPTAGMR